MGNGALPNGRTRIPRSPATSIWKESVTEAERHRWQLIWVQSFGYLDRVFAAKRPEELDQRELFEPIWGDVNRHLGNRSAASMPELVEQLGILRFGQRPKVGDTFCGGGSIPFEAARLGCDVYASDLNPIACMLTWGALNIIGASPETRREIEEAPTVLMAVFSGPRNHRTRNRTRPRRQSSPKLIFIASEVRCHLIHHRAGVIPARAKLGRIAAGTAGNGRYGL